MAGEHTSVYVCDKCGADVYPSLMGETCAECGHTDGETLPKLTKELLLKELTAACEIAEQRCNRERAHVYADHLLLRFIDDDDVWDAYHSFTKWYE